MIVGDCLRNVQRVTSPTHIFLLFCFALLTLTSRASGVDLAAELGEPYELAGKRMAFTNWYFVRPGMIDWLDAEGKSVYVSKTMKAGPDEARFAPSDAPFGIRLIAEPATTRGPLLQREHPWEKNGIQILTVLQKENKFRGWGRCEDAEGNVFGCYFESTDGLTWERPKLGLFEINGSKDNNLIAFDPRSVFEDPAAPPDQRFKSVKLGKMELKEIDEYKKTRPLSPMAVNNYLTPKFVHVIRGAVSPDGLTWTELPQPLSAEVSDTQIVINFDAKRRKYVLYTRTYAVGRRAVGHPEVLPRRNRDLMRRAIGRSESDTFEKFPLSEIIVEPGNDMPPTDTFYTNTFTTIPGAPDQYLMFPAIYHEGNDTTSVELFTSYDGQSWHKVPGSPVLKTAAFGEWNGGCLFAHHNLLELPDGSWALPFTGYVYPHKYPRGAWGYDPGMAIWPKGRLMALEAPEKGEFTTVAVLSRGTKLKINALTDRAGAILVEVADLDGKPIPGRSFADAIPVVGDQFQTPLRWKGGDDIGVETGKPVSLRFRMDRAKLYSLDFE